MLDSHVMVLKDVIARGIWTDCHVVLYLRQAITTGCWMNLEIFAGVLLSVDFMIEAHSIGLGVQNPACACAHHSSNISVILANDSSIYSRLKRIKKTEAPARALPFVELTATREWRR